MDSTSAVDAGRLIEAAIQTCAPEAWRGEDVPSALLRLASSLLFLHSVLTDNAPEWASNSVLAMANQARTIGVQVGMDKADFEHAGTAICAMAHDALCNQLDLLRAEPPAGAVH